MRSGAFVRSAILRTERKDDGWRHMMKTVVAITMFILCGCGVDFRLEAVPQPSYGPWFDGTYRGTYDLPTPQLIVVDLTITDKQIVAIRLRQHPAWKAPEEQEKLIRTVIEHQTTDVYEPRYGESEQDRLLRAIEDALRKARQGTLSVP